MDRGTRKYWFSKKYQIKEVAGYEILMWVFADMSNEDLRLALEHWLAKEDFEYCAALKSEADLRGITLENKIKCKK